MQTIYEKLAFHLCTLGMGMPLNEDLIEILKECLSPNEAAILLLFPTRVAPLESASIDEISQNSHLPREELIKELENLTERGLLFTGKTVEGTKGYALQQVGFGFPQTFFWKGEDTPYARNMANLIGKYFNRKQSPKRSLSRSAATFAALRWQSPYRFCCSYCSALLSLLMLIMCRW